MSFDGPERALSPERPDTANLLEKAIKRRLSNADEQVIEAPSTTKSEGFPTQTVEEPARRKKISDRRASVTLTVSSKNINNLGRDMSRSFSRKENYRVGDVWTLKDRRVVKVLYIGQPNPPFLRSTSNIEDKKWVGLQVLSGQQGKNDGRGPRGKRYFDCPKGKGLFMRQKDFTSKLVNRNGYEETDVVEGQPQARLVNRARSQSNPEGRGAPGPFGLFEQTASKPSRRSTARPPQRYNKNRRTTTGFNPWKQTRYDLKGHNATALSQKNMHRPENQRRRRSHEPAPVSAHKAGPRQIGRNRYKLASEAAGIKAWKASEHKQEVGFKTQRYDLKGITTMAMSQKDVHGHHKVSTGTPAGGMGGHKLGPREIRRQGDRTKLASEMAGIAPATAQQSASYDPNNLFGTMRYDLKGINTMAQSQKDMYGHHKESTGTGFGGHKLGPREIRRQGDQTKLASEMAGIAPATASQSASYDPNNLFAPQRYDTRGLTTTALSQKDLYGHHKESTTGGAGFGGHKMGPREIRQQGDRTKLASEMAGIAPMTAQQSAAINPNALYGTMRYDTKGFTSTARSQKDLYGHHKESTGGAGFGGHKQGPREIGRARGKLASEAAGIAPMSAQQSTYDPNNLFAPQRYDTKGFNTTALSQKDLYGHSKGRPSGGNAFGGHKMGPREIRQQGGAGMLASEAAGIKPMTAQQSAAHDPSRMFDLQRYDRKGFTSTALSQKDLYGHHKGRSNGGGGFGGHKQGPREIGQNREMLASEAAGIQPARAGTSKNGKLFGIRRDTRGFTAMH